MDKDKIRREMERLAAEIEKNAKLYYELDAPIIEDSEYDRLFDTLKRLEQEYPELASTLVAHSPGRRRRRKGIREGASFRGDGKPYRRFFRRASCARSAGRSRKNTENANMLRKRR